MTLVAEPTERTEASPLPAESGGSSRHRRRLRRRVRIDQPASAASAGFFTSCRFALILGLGVPLLLGPITSWPGDVYVWYERVTQASVGVHLYALPGFSYPPAWGYVLGAFGLVAHALHLGPSAFGQPNPLWLRVTSDFLPPVITSFAFNAVLKALLVAMELGSAWFLWRLVVLLGGDERLARRAVSLFVFSPIVLVSVGLHGAFDVMVPLVVLACLVARLAGRPVVCGALVALGVLAKIEPAFLAPVLLASWWWPLAGERPAGDAPTRRLAGVGLFLAGGIGAAAALLAPLAADKSLGSFMVDVFTRVDGPAALGGLGVMGLLRLPGLESVLTAVGGRENHVVGVALEASMIATAVGAAVVWVRARERTGTLLVALSVVVIAVTLLLSPITQPQYLVWLVGPLCALACGSTALRRLTLGVGAAGALYLFGIAGPLVVVAPLLVRIGETRLVASSVATFTRSNLVFGMSDGALATDLACILSVLAVGAVIVFAGRAAAKESARRPSRRAAGAAETAVPTVDTVMTTAAPLYSAARRAKERRLTGRVLAGVVAAFASCELLSVVPLPAPVAPLAATASAAGHGRATIDVSVSAGGTVADDVVAFASSGRRTVRSVVFFEDIAYPESGSTWSEVVGVQDNLEALATAAKVPWHFATVSTAGLRRLLQRPRKAAGTVLVMTSGVLPTAVFSRTIDLIRPWLEAGGILVWSGDLPGYYASGPAPQVATVSEVGRGASSQRVIHFSPEVQVLGVGGADRLLGSSAGLTLGRWYAPAERPSAWATALRLVYPYVHFGPSLEAVSARRAAALGYENGSTVSSSFVSVGRGGVLLFGGFTFASVVASDAARILESGALAALGSPATALLQPGSHRLLTVSVPPGARRLVVVSFNPMVPQLRTVVLRVPTRAVQ